MDECFVCLQAGGALFCFCTCNAVAHRVCFETLVERVPSHRDGCPICKTKYTFQTRKTWRAFAEPTQLVLHGFGVLVCVCFMGVAAVSFSACRTTATCNLSATFLACAAFLCVVFLLNSTAAAMEVVVARVPQPVVCR